MAAGLCLALGAAVVALNAAQADLVWIHSVQKTEWRERWRAEAQHLVVIEASVQGSGAGMDPGEGAVKNGNRWTWKPVLPPLKELPLARSGFTPGDWQLCVGAETCRALGDYFPGVAADAPITLTVCP